MEVYAGFLEHTDHHVGRLHRRARGPGHPRRHAGLRDHRRQRRVGRGDAAAARSTSCSCSTARPRSRRPSSWRPGSTSSGRPRPTTTTRWAGRTPWTRPTSGPSRSPRTGAAPATARSSRWPNGHQGQGRDPRPVPPRHRRRADRPRGGRHPRADLRQRRSSRRRSRASRWPTPSTTPTAADRHTTQYFEMFVNRGIYHQGWTAVTRHSTPWVMAPTLPAFDDDVWELYGPDDWTQAHDLSTEQPEQAGPPPAAVPDRGRQVQRAAARRPARRALQPRPRRAAAAHPRQPPDPVRRDGPADRELGRRAQEQVARGHRPDRRPGRPAPRDRSSPRAAPSAAGAST